MVYVEKKRENTAQIASSACLRSSRSIGHHYVNVWRKNKVAKSGKKISHLQTKIGDTKEFYNRHFIYRKKRSGLQGNLIFNQGTKNIWVFEVVVRKGGGGGGEEDAEKCAYLRKNLGYAPH